MHSRSQSPRKPRSLTRAFAFNGGFFTQKTTRRILNLAGYQIKAGWPSPEDNVVIWGNSPTAHRGKQVAAKQGCSLITVEDAFLRSLFPAKVKGEAAMGLLIDHSGVHFDPSTPSDLEQLLATDPLDDGAVLQRAKLAIERITKSHLSKYTATDLDLPCPEAGYVLVIDQARDDASVTASARSKMSLPRLRHAPVHGARIDMAGAGPTSVCGNVNISKTSLAAIKR